jgi:TAT (twin-arginine translocation) pathway signal sequence
VISIDREDDMDRRIFLAGSAALGAAGALPWSIGAARESPVRHILPTVSHDAMLVKVSFIEPQLPPELMVDGKPVDGAATDGEGLCWAFLATGLTPSRDYTLTSLRRHVVAAHISCAQ